jgi:hypothetical protein
MRLLRRHAGAAVPVDQLGAHAVHRADTRRSPRIQVSFNPARFAFAMLGATQRVKRAAFRGSQDQGADGKSSLWALPSFASQTEGFDLRRAGYHFSLAVWQYLRASPDPLRNHRGQFFPRAPMSMRQARRVPRPFGFGA